MTRPDPVPTMAQVALRAGVALSTVSRALRGRSGVSPAVRAQVLAIADELGYAVSPTASRLATGTTGTVAVVAHRIERWYESAVLAELTRALQAAGWDVLLHAVPTLAERAAFFDRLPLRGKVSAVVLVALIPDPAELVALQRLRLPVVGAGVPLPDLPSATVDDEGGVTGLVQHLRNLGHERIGMLRGLDETGRHNEVAERRFAGYRAGLGGDVDPRLVVSAPWGMDGGAHAMSELLSARRLPTAVVAESDEVAAGALRSLRRSGLRVPGAMSVAGFDGHPFAELLDLTTVVQPIAEQARAAVGLLLGLLEGGADDAGAARHVVLPGRLVTRGTTAAP